MNGKHISKEDILRLTNNGYDILNRYLGQYFPEGKIQTGKAICSPFREDKHPSFSVYQNEQGVWRCKDYGRGNYDKDCLEFYQWRNNLPDFPTTLKAISEEFRLGLNGDQEYKTAYKSKPVSIPPNPQKDFSVSIKKRDNWKEYELDYWQQYGNEQTTLQKFNVYAVESFSFETKKGKSVNISSTPENPIFAYEVGEGIFKIYQPLTHYKNYKFRWIGSKPEGFIFGWDQLPDKGIYVFITGGEKDVISLCSKGFSAFCLNSETANLDSSIVEELSQRFEQIIILYDIDKTGLEASKKLAEAFNLPRLILPSSLESIAGGKDISDYFKACLVPEYQEEFSELKFREMVENIPIPIPPPPIIKLSDYQIGFDIWLFEIKTKIVEGVPVSKKLIFKGLYREGIINLLAHNGYYKRYQQEHNYIFIHEENNIIDEMGVPQMKDFAVQYVKSIEEPLAVEYDGIKKTVSPHLLIETFLRQSHLIFNDKFLEHLPNHEKPILRDNDTTCFIPYQDTIVAIDDNGHSIICYKDLGNTCIWRKQIIDRDFHYVEDCQKGHFARFIANISNQDEQRKEAFHSAIGYLIHNYNHPSRGQAVICYDEKITNLHSPQGGTGKGLFANGIKAIRDTVKIDGKKFKEDNRFCFQDISLSTQVAWFDDVKPDLGFDRFNSILTDGWNVEQKYKPSFFIHPEQSPKMLICSNSILDNEGTTRKRRQFILEFGNYYSSQIKTGVEEPIIQIHQCTFFSKDWDENEWYLFDSFMVSCCELYMNKGLLSFPVKNVIENRIRQTLGEEFYEWVTDQQFVLDKNYETKPLYEEYKKLYYGEDEQFKQRKFTNMLKRYAEIKSWKLKCSSSHGTTYFKFINGN